MCADRVSETNSREGAIKASCSFLSPPVLPCYYKGRVKFAVITQLIHLVDLSSLAFRSHYRESISVLLSELLNRLQSHFEIAAAPGLRGGLGIS